MIIQELKIKGDLFMKKIISIILLLLPIQLPAGETKIGKDEISKPFEIEIDSSVPYALTIDTNSNPNDGYVVSVDTKANITASNYIYGQILDLSNATTDYFLRVGEVAKISFTNATSVPLHIATQDGTYYELHLLPSNTGGTSGSSATPVYLNPNNTTYTDAFVYAEMYRTSVGSGSNYNTYSAFRIGYAFPEITFTILNRTVYKSIKGYVNLYGYTYGYPAIVNFATNWRDTTTEWTSLGTITFPQATSGDIIIKRLM